MKELIFIFIITIVRIKPIIGLSIFVSIPSFPASRIPVKLSKLYIPENPTTCFLHSACTNSLFLIWGYNATNVADGEPKQQLLIPWFPLLHDSHGLGFMVFSRALFAASFHGFSRRGHRAWAHYRKHRWKLWHVSFYMVTHVGSLLELFNFVRMELVYVATCALVCSLPHPSEPQERLWLVHTVVESLRRFRIWFCCAALEIRVTGFQEASYNFCCSMFCWCFLLCPGSAPTRARTSFTNFAEKAASATVLYYLLGPVPSPEAIRITRTT